MGPSNGPGNNAPGGNGSFFDRFRNVNPDTLRSQVENMTASDLENLIQRMSDRNRVPDAFRNDTIHRTIDSRLEQLGIREETRQRWRDVQAGMQQRTQDAADRMSRQADQRFINQLIAGSGGTAILGIVGLKIASWFGFRPARRLDAETRRNGLVRGTINTIQHHPILAVFLTASGVTAGSLAYNYFTDNGNEIVEHIMHRTRLGGGTAEQMARTLGERARDFVAHAGVRTTDGLVNVMTRVFGGTMDPVTGRIDVPGTSMRPSAYIALQAGYRRRREDMLTTVTGGRDYLNVALHDIEQGFHLGNTNRADFDKAARANALLSQGKTGTKEFTDLIEDLQKRGVLKVDPKKVDSKVVAADLSRAQTELKHEYWQQDKDFNHQRQSIQAHLDKAEELKRQGKLTDAELGKIHTELKRDCDELYQKTGKGKEAAAKKFAEAASQHIEHKLGKDGGKLESIIGTAEGVGAKIFQNRAGKLVVGSVMCWNMLPLFGETLSAGAHWLGGESKKINTLASKRQQNLELNDTEDKDLETFDRLEAKLRNQEPLTLDEKNEFERLENEYVVDETNQKIKTAALDWAPVVGGFIPGVGEALDLYNAVSGKDLNGREIDTWTRVTSGVMGVLGTASIALGFLTGGTTWVAFKGLRTMIAGRKAWRAGHAVETITRTTKTLNTINNTADAGKAAMAAADTFGAVSKAATNMQYAQRIVRDGQRLAQLYTYGHLGVQVTMGVKEWVVSGAEKVEQGRQAVMEGIGSVERIFGGGRERQPGTPQNQNAPQQPQQPRNQGPYVPEVTPENGQPMV